VTNCSTDGSQEVDRLFKPYMQFDDTSQTIYRNWYLASNYLISRAAPQFDRSADVLQ